MIGAKALHAETIRYDQVFDRLRNLPGLEEPFQRQLIHFPNKSIQNIDAVSMASPDAAGPLTRETAAAVIEQFRKLLPQVIFLLKWDSRRINGDAYHSAGHDFVRIYGGILRHPALGSEGLSLVIAHELGHLYGGDPKTSDGLSTEQQADYWAASAGLRSLWGQDYEAKMPLAIEQFKAYAAFEGENPTCRIKIFEAGMNNLPKPACN